MALSAAAVLLGAAGLFGVAHAETAPGHPALPDGAWEAAAEALSAAWAEVDEDLHREEARLAAGFPMPRLQPPQLRQKDGQLHVTLRLRRGADLSAVLRELASSLGAAGRSDKGPSVREGDINMQVTDCGASTVLRCTAPGGDPGALRADVFIPKAGNWQMPEVDFTKMGAFSRADLGTVAVVMRAANNIVQHHDGVSSVQINGGSGWEEGAGPFGRIDEAMRSFQHGAQLFGAFPEDVASMFRDLHRDMGSLLGGFPGMQERRELDDPGLDEFPAPAQQWPPRQLQPRPSEQPTLQRQSPQQQGQVPAEAPTESQYGSPEADAAVQKLQSMGATVYPPGNKDAIDWGVLAGYDDQKRQIEDTLLLALQHPEIYDDIAKRTRKSYASNKPRAVLFEGPPGTGKTTSARVIANQASVPLIYIPLEAVGSKWYGESEKLLSDAFKAADSLPGSIIFLDELDSLATTRGADMHEATRRLLGVLLRQLDGFDANKRSVVVGATNRMEDLDPALLSRMDTAITFGLPEEDTRRQIMHNYATHLTDDELKELASMTGGLSGRDLRDLAEQTERRWASKIIKGEVQKTELPKLEDYKIAAEQRVRTHDEANNKRARGPLKYMTKLA